MSTQIFKNQTKDIDKAGDKFGNTFRAKGRLQVNISGILGGADVITYLIGVGNIATEIAVCSWKTSLGETLLNGADSGIIDLNNCNLGFKIINAGATTNINLEYSVE